MATRQAARKGVDDADDRGDSGNGRPGNDRSSNGSSGNGRHSDGHRSNGRRPARELLRSAAGELAELTGCEVAGVSALERGDDGWRVDVEVVELRRVPDTTSVLATYEVELDEDGEVVGYRRVRRYNRASTEDM